MSEYLFSFDNYRKILNLIKGRIKDYKDIHPEDESFVILRHDVEFSPKRAFDLAKIEFEQGIYSSFFFQISNNAYNILSGKNIIRIKEIAKMGHHIGLHFHLQGSVNLKEITNRIRYECDIMSHVLGISIDRFSFHRPSDLVLESNIEIPGIINAYHPMYFTYTNNIQNIDFQKSVKYIADSRNEWSYIYPFGSPCHEFFKTYPKVQMLCHPYSWTETGYTTLDNLRSLIYENRKEFIDTLDSETKYVKEYIDEL